MKVVLVSTSDIHGGAAISCNRLLQALHKKKVDVRSLVQRKTSTQNIVETTTHSTFKTWINFYRFALERFIFYTQESSKAVRFFFSLGNTGENIVQHPLIKNADVTLYISKKAGGGQLNVSLPVNWPPLIS